MDGIQLNRFDVLMRKIDFCHYLFSVHSRTHTLSLSYIELLINIEKGDRSKWKTRTNLSTLCWKLFTQFPMGMAFLHARTETKIKVYDDVNSAFVLEWMGKMNGWTERVSWNVLWMKCYPFLPFHNSRPSFSTPIYCSFTLEGHALYIAPVHFQWVNVSCAFLLI